MLRFEQAVENSRFSKSLISRKTMQLNDTSNVMTELAPKGPRFVEIIEIMDRPDIPFPYFSLEAKKTYKRWTGGLPSAAFWQQNLLSPFTKLWQS